MIGKLLLLLSVGCLVFPSLKNHSTGEAGKQQGKSARVQQQDSGHGDEMNVGKWITQGPL